VNGTLLFDVFYYPILHPDLEKALRSTETGIVNLNIHQTKGIKREDFYPRKLVATVSFSWTGPPSHKTPPVEFTDSLVWNSSFDFLCFDKGSTTVVIKIVDRDDGKWVAGHFSMALADLLELETEDGKVEWFSLSGCPNGQLRLGATWNPIRY
jgi:Ca2+-dependent lipid-binding protein